MSRRTHVETILLKDRLLPTRTVAEGASKR